MQTLFSCASLERKKELSCNFTLLTIAAITLRMARVFLSSALIERLIAVEILEHDLIVNASRYTELLLRHC